MADLLIELFSEEIPARMQARAADDLRRLMTDKLVNAGLTYANAAAHATPRRLALALDGLPAQTKAVREERKGPRADAPEKAIEGFLRGAGVTRDQLEVRPSKKGDLLFAIIEKPGRPAAEIIAETLEATIRDFPWPKSMRWGTGTLRWVRPLQSILCILSDETGAQIVPLNVDGIEAGALTHGHRFMGKRDIAVSGFDDYAEKLQDSHVILRAEDRAELIRHDAAQIAFARNMTVAPDAGLLAEVSGLVEWPVVLMGGIDAAFLDLPAEVLQTSMKEHQKFFSVLNPETDRIEAFITVANIETADHGATILAGNQKVLFARLSDAKFFWENDLRTPMADMAAKLSNVTFHAKLGSQAQRIERIAALAREIAPMVGADADLAERAARLAKADLSSQMVYEFPELQGVMGRYYALKAGEDEAVAAACAEHYAPLGPSDAVPTAPVSMAVSLAEKIDILCGFWAIDEKPTGSKDPYALRRAALGVIRVVLEKGLRIRLNGLLAKSLRAHRDHVPPESKQPEVQIHSEEAANIAPDAAVLNQSLNWTVLRQDLLSFFADRLKAHLKAENIRHDVIEACFALGDQDDFTTLVARVHALQAFVTAEDGANLLQGYRRAVNILTAEEKKDGVEYALDPEPKLAEAGAERALFKALDGAEAEIDRSLSGEDFAAAMAAMAGLRAPIDAFFTDVVVNAEVSMVRRNRLCLLNRIRALLHRVAIFSALEG
jgi:glycyl-tRNA synthetase beta chain